MTLTEFLLARIEDDEDLVMEGDWPFPGSGERGFDSRRRMLAECDAKRRIVDLALHHFGGQFELLLLRILAAPYADHPDYQEEWKS